MRPGPRRRSCSARCSPIPEPRTPAAEDDARARPRPGGLLDRPPDRRHRAARPRRDRRGTRRAADRDAARGSGGRRPPADAMATLGSSLVHAGRTREGLAYLDQAAAALDGVPLGRVLVRRAYVLRAPARPLRGESRRPASRAAAVLGRGTRTGRRERSTSRALDARMGAVESAALAFAESARSTPPSTTRATWRSASTTQAGSRSSAATCRTRSSGTPPRRRFDAVGITSVDLVVDQASAYLSGGLARDALDVVEGALVARPLRARSRPTSWWRSPRRPSRRGDWKRAVSAADEARR